MRTNTRKFRLVSTPLVLVVALVLTAGAALAGPPNYWPMFNRDLLNTGVADPTLTGIASPVEMWNYTTDNQIGSGSPVIGDIDGDGKPEVLVPTANFAGTGGIYAFENNGTLKWKYETGDYGTYATPPLADIDGDGKLETIFPSYFGKIVAVDDDGTEIWSVDKASGGTRSVIADITVDSGLEVVAGAASKTFLLKASDGTQLWEADYRMLCDPAIADVDGDGKLEIVFSATGKFIVALNAEDGSAAWTSTLMGQDAQNNLAVISDIDDDGKPDVVAGARDTKMYVFSGADGTKLWEYSVIGRCFSAGVADFNGDGFDDVVTTAGTKTTMVSYNPRVYKTESYVYVLDVKNQALLWQHDIVGKKSYSTERSPSIADVNGDGTPDVLIAGLSQNLYALSGIDGSEIWTIATNDPSSGVPAIGDLDGDGYMEIVVSAGSSVQVFTQEPPPIVLMLEFEIDHAKFDCKKEDGAKVHVKGELELATTKDISDDVVVTVGSLSCTIDQMEEKGKEGEHWEYNRPKGNTGGIKHMKIDWNKGTFDFEMDGLNLTGVERPVTISVQIGDDLGQATVLTSKITEVTVDSGKKEDGAKVRVKGELGFGPICGPYGSPTSSIIVSVTQEETNTDLSWSINQEDIEVTGKEGESWEYKPSKHTETVFKHAKVDWKRGTFDFDLDGVDLGSLDLDKPVQVSVTIEGNPISETVSLTGDGKKDQWKPQAVADPLRVVAYPNPIRDVHTATFQVMGMLAAEVEEIRVQIFDLSGRLVWEDAAFRGELDWHTDSLSGDYLANGMYLYRVQVRIDGNWISQDIGRIAVLR